jgi:WD40 repeat protein
MTPASHDSARDRQLEEILHAYLQAVDAGQAPDRETLLRHHPDLASELAAFFAGQDEVAQLARRMVEPIAPAPPITESLTLAPSQVTMPAVGTQLRYVGDYELLEEIARGGMGVVYKARQVSLNRQVALKMILAGQLASPQDVQRFHTEAEAAANLDHPHIVPIYEVGEHHGQHYFSMKLIDGGSLTRQVASFVKDPRAAVRLLATVARAVHHAHQRGILHRDLKPGNILLSPLAPAGRGDERDGFAPHVTDFGLAKRVEGDRGQTQTGVIVGTPSYMPPEQARAEKSLTTAVDVYSLGAILYECLTGRPPFRAATSLDTILQVLAWEPDRPRSLNAGVPRDLEIIALKCLEKDPQRRYDSAAALAEDLERWLRGEPIHARPSTAWEQATKWAKRRPAAAALLGVTTAGILLLFAVILAFTFQLQAALGATQEQRDLAERRRQEADKERRRALEQEGQARRRELLARHYWYGAHLDLARQALEASNSRRLLNVLDRPGPPHDRQDVRTFEWYYLSRLAHAERLTLRGHTERPTCLVYAPDGDSLASASSGEIKMWDLARGRERWSALLPSDGDMVALAFSPDGKTLATGWSYRPGKKRQDPLPLVQLWDATTGRKVSDLCRVEGFGLAAAITFSADSRALTLAGVSASDPRKRPPGEALYLGHGADVWIWTWDLAGGRGQRTSLPFPGVQFRELTQALSPDGQTLALSGYALFLDKKVNQHIHGCWDVATARPRSVLRGQDWGTRSVVFSPDARTIANLDALGRIKLRDTGTGQERTAPPWRLGRLGGLTFSADGRTLAATTEDGTVRRWNLASGREELPLLGLAYSAGCIAFSPDGNTLAAGSSDTTIKVWDTTAPSGTVLPAIDSSFPPFAVTPDGKTLIVAQSDHLKVCDLPAGKERGRLKGFGEDLPGQVLPPEKQAKVASTTYVHFLVVSQDSRFLAVGGAQMLAKGMSQTVDVWELASGRKQAHLPDLGPLGGIVVRFTPDGRFLIIGKMVWRVDSWTRAADLVPEDSIHARAMSPDGRLYLTGQNFADLGKNSVRFAVRELATGALRFEHVIRSYWCDAAAFSPDGIHLALAGLTLGERWKQGDNKVRVGLWDMATGKEEVVFEGHDNAPIVRLTFSPAGDTLVTSSHDRTVKCWDPLTGQERLTLRYRDQVPADLAFTRDGETLVVSWRAERGGLAKPAAVTLHRAPRGKPAGPGADKGPEKHRPRWAAEADKVDPAWTAPCRGGSS